MNSVYRFTSDPYSYLTWKQGLKINGDIINKEFLLLPMVTDTVKKINTKNQLEKRLKSIERNITGLREKISNICLSIDE